jgi:hypothetical protein
MALIKHNYTQMNSAKKFYLPEEDLIIQAVAEFRINIIKDFLDERYLLNYLSQQYGRMDLSGTTLEAIRGDLKELLMQPFDKTSYELLIYTVRDNPESLHSKDTTKCFFLEVKEVLKKHF